MASGEHGGNAVGRGEQHGVPLHLRIPFNEQGDGVGIGVEEG